eukprot:TRINITY_DN3977_c0_g1_i1.p1 TRINITY_DN3977_c0_g1~~TRINITY_DN3977_c0_g1_i1.p1  ORF type:complete len:176 (+),score=35.34 TRINITY_DN3977_c0_g1_i1:36-563(+)
MSVDDVEAREEARLLKNRSSKPISSVAAAPKRESKLGGGNPKCHRCGQTVYHNEKAIAAGKDWHQSCLKCATCGKVLNATILCENNDKVYCQVCYGRQFGPKGVGYGLGGALTSHEGTADVVSHSDPTTAPAPTQTQTQNTQPQPDSNAGPSFCPNCGNPCSGMKFCSSCGTKLR